MLRFRLRHRCRRQVPSTQAVSRPLLEQLEDRRLLNAGALDPFFGFLGRSVTPLLSSAADAASATAFQSDGKLIVAGTSADGSTFSPGSFALARYDANGTLDWSFGLGGRATAFFGPAIAGPGTISASVAGIAIQPDGKIVVAGSISGGLGLNFALARFTPDGWLDPTFGSGGEIITQFFIGTDNAGNPAPAESSAASVTLQSDGKIVAVGQAGGTDFALARYNADGTLDTTFGTGGEVTNRLSPADSDAASTVTVQTNGQILVAGYAGSFFSHNNFALLRYNGSNGSLDASFGTGGVVTTDFSPVSGRALSSDARAVAVQANGTIRVAGKAGLSSAPDMALAQYTSSGQLDTSFDSGGKVTTAFAYTFAPIGEGVSFTPSGQVVVVGSTSGSTPDFAVERYNADGSLDTTFGTGGQVTTDFGGTDKAKAVAIKADGTLAVAGSTTSNNGDFAVARYSSNGSLLTSFGHTGKVTTDFFFSTVQPTNPVFGLPASSGFTVALPDGDLLVAGTITPDGRHGEWVLTRYNAFGWLDLTFGNLGTVVTNFGASASASVSGIAVGPDGKIVLVGSVFDPTTGTGSDIAVARYNADGSPDTSFNGTGTLAVDFNGMNDTGSGVAVLPNGEILVVGTTVDPNSGDNDFALAEITTTGTLDTSFGGGGTGEVFTDFGVNAEATGVVLSGGQILVGGTAFNSTNFLYDNMAVARYNADGTLDPNFGNAGLATADFGAETKGSSIAVEPNGTIVVGGTTANVADPTGLEHNFALARFTTGGLLDASFGSGGEFSFNFNGGIDDAAAIAIQSDGKILIAGTRTDTTTFNSNFALARVTVNGTLDATFGNGGEVTTDFGGTDVAASVVLTPGGNIVVGGSTFGNGGGYLALACYFGDSDHCWNW